MNRLEMTESGLSFRESKTLTPFTQRGILAWPLFGRYLNEGESVVAAVLRDYRAAGANTVACADMLAWWPGLTPANPKFWPSINPFVDMADSEGIRVQWPVLCDTRSLMPDLHSMQAHWTRFLVNQADRNNVTFIGANQPSHQAQSPALDPFALYKPIDFPYLLCARENPNTDANPLLPAMDFTCACLSRTAWKWWIEMGAQCGYYIDGWGPGEPWQGSHRALVLFETPHADDTGEFSNPDHWKKAALSIPRKRIAGANFYCSQAAAGELLTGTQRACAVEFLGNLPDAWDVW